MRRRHLVIGIILIAWTGICQAGWLDSTLENVGKKLGNRAVNDATDGAYDAAKGGAKEAVKGDAGKNKNTAKGAASQAVKGESSDPATGAPSIEEAEQASTKFDFIPGDKVIYFDDFSDTDVGEFPRKWTLEGPKQSANNTVDVVEYQGKHFLRSVPGAKSQYPATQYLRLEQKGDFPEKFTIEFDAVLDSISKGSNYYIVYRVMFVSPDKKIDVFRWNSPNSVQISGKENSSANTKTIVDLNDGAVHHVAISVNGSFLKAYIDHQRVINDPDGIKRPVKQLGLQMLTHNNMKSDKILFSNFRVAAGGKDIRSALETDGKIVTHGILFDTGQATLKAESLPTLKMILKLLNEDPELKFSIEGHTDNRGGKGINKPLSEDRANAVRAWLEGKGIESARLKTAGFGDTKPIDSNATLEGRANNRRVEFIKF